MLAIVVAVGVAKVAVEAATATVAIAVVIVEIEAIPETIPADHTVQAIAAHLQDDLRAGVQVLTGWMKQQC